MPDLHPAPLRRTFRPRLATPSLPTLPANVLELSAILAGGTLRAVFQPIFDYRTQSWLGYEGLIRGPTGSRLESPLALLEAADGPEMRLAFDMACWKTLVSAFAEQQLSGHLFLNVTPSSLLSEAMSQARWANEIRNLGVDPARIVIELTENQQIQDFAQIRQALGAVRSLGFRIAIDDLGEGFSNLRMWSEVRPEFVKIDRHFVQGIADDVLKFHLVRAMHELAELTGAAIIAEGIESLSDFTAVRDLGIACGQGFFIARPAALPVRHPSRETLDALHHKELVVFPNPRAPSATMPVRDLARPLPTLLPHSNNDEAFALFEANPDLHVLPVVDVDAEPVGMLSRSALVDRFARPFRRELYGRRTCATFMDTAPLVIDHSVTVEDVGRIISRGERQRMLDGFIITENGAYLGVGSCQDLMALITEMQITAARYANPLTALPGAVPLNEHIDRLLDLRLPFCACYFDINNFKPFNDHYGYRAGDHVIQMLSNVLREAVDAKRDFVAHIGGDDFMIVFQSEDWEARCSMALTRFDQRLMHFLPFDDHARGGIAGTDRKGLPVLHELPSLAVGAVRSDNQNFTTHHEVSAATAAAKKMAKRIPRSTLFIERRCASCVAEDNAARA